MTREVYAMAERITAEEIREIRKKLKLTQAVFAELVNVSKKTVERWESGGAEVTGPVVPLIRMLQTYPEFEQRMRIPAKVYPLRLWYMYRNEACTLLDVDERRQKIRIYNYTDDLLFRAFGRTEHPTYQQYEEFMESRCFPRSRDKLKLQLAELGVPFYDTLLIIEKTEGRMADDEFWIRIER
ncbi:MAG: helix-turn-helix domain-containing protein [Lachnospiraceae bacterium]|nr:helix-turn-helix domain-containing protein [Lachnospiraceae bacterium]